MASTINASTSSGLVNTADTSGVLQLQTASTAAVTIDASQNVGIGTASPTDNLYISRSTNAAGGISVVNTNNAQASQIAQLYLQGGDNAYAQIKLQASSVNSSIRGNNDGSLAFLSSTTERMRIDSSGRVLINTDSLLGNSAGNLQLYPSTIGSDQYGMLTGGNGTQYNVYAIRFINTYTPSIVGSIYVGSSSTAYNTSSDYRLKEDITPMTGALATVESLKPVTYKWKIDGSTGQGFIAHELQAVVPDCVTGVKDGVETVDDVDSEGNVIGTKEVPVYQGIDTSFLVATLTAAIQELKAVVDAQAAEIAALKTKVGA